jgi:hypothetical protein
MSYSCPRCGIDGPMFWENALDYCSACIHQRGPSRFEVLSYRYTCAARRANSREEFLAIQKDMRNLLEGSYP